MNDICGLCMLHYYTEHPDLLEKEKEQAEKLLQRYLLQGMQFGFYQKLSSDLKAKYQLYGRYYIEYRTGEQSRVLIRYENNMQGEFTEEMPEMYEGIFVKEMILFAGDEVRYRILEETDDGTKETDKGRIRYSQEEKEKTTNRYERLNEILLGQDLKDEKAFLSKMREYEQLDSVVEETFTILG